MYAGKSRLTTTTNPRLTTVVLEWITFFMRETSIQNEQRNNKHKNFEALGSLLFNFRREVNSIQQLPQRLQGGNRDMLVTGICL
jgi:hypothetical protein